MFFLREPYKRAADHVQSPFRYPGGKHYALKFILPFLHSVPHDEYREPFVGGGSVFFGKEKAKYNWLNDLEKNIIQTYKTIADPELIGWLVNKVGSEVATKERHTEMKKERTK